MLRELEGEGLLIHHWDADGICSARLLLEHLSDKTIDNKTPELGNYFLTKKELKNYSNYDFIIVADMALPEDNILELAKNAKILIFDHHIQREIKQVFHHNPIIKGKKPDEYPSTSWIINKYLNNPVNLFVLLGIVGDHENEIKNNKLIFKIISDFCQKNNMKFNDLLKMVNLLDSNYKLGDKESVEEAPHLLLEYKDANDILNNNRWNENLAVLSKEISRQLKKPVDEVNGTILKKINTTYNIISTVTRKIAWGSGKNTLVINTGFFDNMDQIYVRSNKNNLEPMIRKWKSLGFKCGGKKEVLGAIVPKDKTESFVEELLDFLSN